METLIKKTMPLYGINFVEIFKPLPETPNTYLFNLDGHIFSYRRSANLIFIGGEEVALIHSDIIIIVRRLINKAKHHQ